MNISWEETIFIYKTSIALKQFNSIYDVNLDGNLTDRLNSAGGLVPTCSGGGPVRRATQDLASLLAPSGQDGSLGRNTVRAGNYLDLNLALLKNVSFDDQRKLVLRMDIFNFINRASF